MGFDPIAIVGRGCVFPDALDPDTFWDNVAARRCSLSPVPDGRWRLPHRWAMGTVDDHLDRTWNDVGGYVRDFGTVFDPTGFRVAPEEILGLDQLFHWVLYGARQALREAGHEEGSPRTGLVLGNLSYPTSAGTAFAEHVWLSGERPACCAGRHGTGPTPATASPPGFPPTSRPGRSGSAREPSPSTPPAPRPCTRSNWPATVCTTERRTSWWPGRSTAPTTCSCTWGSAA